MLLAANALARERQGADLVPRVHCWIVAPNYALARPIWRLLKAKVPSEMVIKSNETNMTMELIDDILIEMKSADRPEHLVGVGLDILMISEAGLVPAEAWNTSLQPRLLSPGRAHLALISGTPKAGNQWLQRLYEAGQRGDPKIESWRFPTSANPAIPIEDIDAMKACMTERAWRQELEAEFLSGEGAVFRNPRACIVEPRSRSGSVCVGIDFASVGGSDRKDYTACVACDSSGFVLDIDRWHAPSWEYTRKRIVEFCDRNGPISYLVPEVNSFGDPVVEQLKSMLPKEITFVPFYTSSTKKRELIERLVYAIENKKVTYTDRPELLNELCLYEISMTEIGNTRFSAPSGQHDDLVISLALANFGVELAEGLPKPYSYFGVVSERGISWVDASGYHQTFAPDTNGFVDTKHFADRYEGLDPYNKTSEVDQILDTLQLRKWQR